MKKISLSLLLSICSLCGALAQYRYDQVAYHTIYLEDLPQALKKTPHHLLLDVRSSGEYHDTSSFHGLNIGRLKGSRNISIREIETRLAEIKEYKDQPVYLYCSHSQRSRRVGKMLADSGFTNVTNVNGGMTEFHLLKSKKKKLNALFERNSFFDLVAPEAAYKLIKSTKELTIIDVRPDSAFAGITTDEKLNAFGRLKGSVHLPLTRLKTSVGSIPKSTSLLLVDSYGNESETAATYLHDLGYHHIQVLFNGLDEWISCESFKGKDEIWDHSNKYGLISSVEFDHRMQVAPPPVILDVRTIAEYTNQDTVMSYHNRGHIQGAVNIPVKELKSRMQEIDKYKSNEVIIYAFSNSPEAFEAAHLLTAEGFSRVYILTGGLWDLRWKAANLKGLSGMMKWVVDVPAENR